MAFGTHFLDVWAGRVFSQASLGTGLAIPIYTNTAIVGSMPILNPGGSGGTPAEGQLLFAGYGGAFLSHALTAAAVGSQRANISTWYVPFEFGSNGVPAKAHVVSIDPTPGNSSISLVHADGVRIDLTEDAGGGGPGIVASINGSTFLRFADGELSIQAEKILLKGNCYLGRNAEAGLPLLAGAASPPCPSLFVSPT